MSLTTQTGPSTAPVVDVRGLRVTCRQHGGVLEAVRGVDFQLRAGEILSIVGESGSGKSSIASAELGLHHGSTTVPADSLRVVASDLAHASRRRSPRLRHRGTALDAPAR